MPDPRELKVGDRVRFVSFPVEWKDPEYSVPEENRALMEILISRKSGCRVSWIADDGYPWLEARIRQEDGFAAKS